MTTVAEAAKWADVVMVSDARPDRGEALREEIAPNLKRGQTAHVRAWIQHSLQDDCSAAGIDVGMAAPKAPGHRVREVFTEGGGVPGLIAIHQDATGNAHALCLSYLKGIGCTRAGVLEPRSKKRPKPISSASRLCCAVA